MSKNQAVIKGNRIKFLREQLGISRYKLADVTGIAVGVLFRIENEESDTSVSTMIKLADYFDVSLDYLCGRCSDKEYKGIVENYKEASYVRKKVAEEEYRVREKGEQRSLRLNDQVSAEYPYNLLEDLYFPLNNNRGGTHRKDSERWQTVLTDSQREGLEYAIDNLKDIQKKCVLAYYRDEEGLREIGEENGISHERVRQIINAALGVMRHPVYSNRIRYGKEEVDKRDKEFNEKLKGGEKYLYTEDTRLDKAGFSVKLVHALRDSGIYTVGDLKKIDDKFIEELNVGKNLKGKLRRKLKEYGLND